MPITRKCDRCGKEKEHTVEEWANEAVPVFKYQVIGNKRHTFCVECIDKYDHLVRVINEKHQADKQKSLHIWLNNKYD